MMEYQILMITSTFYQRGTRRVVAGTCLVSHVGANVNWFGAAMVR
jgi:hypothetical protein